MCCTHFNKFPWGSCSHHLKLLHKIPCGQCVSGYVLSAISALDTVCTWWNTIGNRTNLASVLTEWGSSQLHSNSCQASGCVFWGKWRESWNHPTGLASSGLRKDLNCPARPGCSQASTQSVRGLFSWLSLHSILNRQAVHCWGHSVLLGIGKLLLRRIANRLPSGWWVMFCPVACSVLSK